MGPQGGIGFYAKPIVLQKQAKPAIFEYQVYFSEGFAFALGSSSLVSRAGSLLYSLPINIKLSLAQYLQYLSFITIIFYYCHCDTISLTFLFMLICFYVEVKLPGRYGGRPVEIYSGGVQTDICFSTR